ncbi:MAG: hypothetical protein ACR2H4_16010 [Pyrinomonadaceae bacterium]
MAEKKEYHAIAAFVTEGINIATGAVLQNYCSITKRWGSIDEQSTVGIGASRAGDGSPKGIDDNVRSGF